MTETVKKKYVCYIHIDDTKDVNDYTRVELIFKLRINLENNEYDYVSVDIEDVPLNLLYYCRGIRFSILSIGYTARNMVTGYEMVDYVECPYEGEDLYNFRSQALLQLDNTESVSINWNNKRPLPFDAKERQ